MEIITPSMQLGVFAISSIIICEILISELENALKHIIMLCEKCYNLKRLLDLTNKIMGAVMILSGSKIREEIGKSIIITPFDDNKINSNSYYLTLADHLYVYNDEILDMKKDYRDSMKRIVIPDEGLVLNPGILYLGSTVEKTCTTKYIPIIEGRSSTARLGLFVHVSAGLGEAGFDGHWTLELSCIQPLRIYSGIPICHIYYNVIDGYADQCKNTKYQNSTDAEPSKIKEDLGSEYNA